jgi:hypothetical protein
MWKPLAFSERVHPGDKIRFHHTYKTDNNTEALFKVVKSDQHYFEILPIIQNNTTKSTDAKKIVRYFDLGYNIEVDLWHE